jgi:coproporphyrinogen III oxidase
MTNLHKQSEQYFQKLQDIIIAAFEDIEQQFTPPLQPDQKMACFRKKSWVRDLVSEENQDKNKNKSHDGGGDVVTTDHDEPGIKSSGGGTMAIMEGRVFEKVGVNFSSVQGKFSKTMQKSVKGADQDPSFKATGISLVAHFTSPHIPAIHMNLRHIATTKDWFGGGIDMTPVFENQADTNQFHHDLKTICDRHDPKYYPEFKAWCDRYFYLPHRQEARGIGGIFFDHLGGDIPEGSQNPEHIQQKAKDFMFVQDVGDHFLSLILPLIKRDAMIPWNEEQRQQQLLKRGRYVEFNLLYDRGTQFGLKTGGNVEAILMSMPPLASWKPSV